MATDPITDPNEHDTISLSGRVWLVITRTFLKGLIAILPIAATVYVLVWLAGFLDTPGRGALEGIQLAMGIRKPYNIPGTGLLLGLIVIFCVGVLINAWVIRQLLFASEGLLQKLPLAKTVFSSVRDLMGFFSKSGKKPGGHVVLVDYAAGTKLIGIVTRDDLSDVAIGPEADQMVAVYLPFSYAVGGWTVIMPRASLKVIKMSPEEAMRFAITGGMKKTEENRKPAVIPAPPPPR